MSLIKNTRTVGSKLDASNFLQRVYDLFGTYIKQKIVVSIIQDGNIILTQFEIKGMFEFEHVVSILRLNSYSSLLVCQVEVLA